MKRYPMMMLMLLLFVSPVLGFSLSNIFQRNEEGQGTMVDVEEVIQEINLNQAALDQIRESKIESLTIKTDKRVINLSFQGGRVILAEQESDNVVKSTESKLSRLWQSFESGDDLSLGDVKSAFSVPLKLYWKIAYNLW